MEMMDGSESYGSVRFIGLLRVPNIPRRHLPPAPPFPPLPGESADRGYNR